MKLFRKNNILFKLIVCLIICSSFVCAKTNSIIYAVCNDEHIEAEGSPKTVNQGTDAAGIR